MATVLQPGALMRSTQGRIKGFQMAVKKWGKCSGFTDQEFFLNRRAKSSKEKARTGTLVHLDIERYGGDIAQAFYEMAKKLFRSGPLPDAIMCPNDRAAFGVFNAAYECGLRIPQDIAVTGSDDDHFGRFPMFSLTTIRLAAMRSCQEAVSLLLQRLRKPNTPPKKCAFPSTLVLRQSCGREIRSGEEGDVCVPSTTVPGDI